MIGPRIKVGSGLLLQSRIVPTHAIDYKLNIFTRLTFTKRNDIVHTLSRAVFFLFFQAKECIIPFTIPKMKSIESLLMWSHHGNQTFRPPSNSTRLFLQISWDITYGSIHIMYECIFSISMSAFLSFWKYQRYSRVTWGDTRLQFFILGPFIRGKIRRVLHKARLK